MTAQSGTAASPLRRLSMRALPTIGISVLAIALWARWDWLAAAGLAPIILAMLPCAVMCALGVCMHRFIPQSKSGSCRAASGTIDGSGDAK
jgi:hypothetical protein